MKSNQCKLSAHIIFLTLSLLVSTCANALEPQVLYSFQTGAGLLLNGVHPQAGLTLGPDGNFYGTTRDGGSNNAGTIFRLSASGVFTSLFAFSTTNGSAPQASLTLGKDGNFYGTTVLGGPNNFGTVFRDRK